MRPALIAALASVPFCTFALSAAAQTVETSAGGMTLIPMVTGLDEPWGMEILPDDTVLITQRGGVLLRVTDGVATPVEGGPEVVAEGQGGLLDVMVPRDFARTREVWLTYAATVRGGTATAVGRGVLSADGTKLEGFETTFTGTPAGGGRHFGSRLVEAADGSLYLTTGDRGTGPEGQEAQDPALTHGKVIRLTRGGAPTPALGNWAEGVHSRGHRNIQGAAILPDGGLLVVEHGAQGGDEVNLVKPGKNYGWPVISYGVNYNGDKIGEGAAKSGMEQPLHYWDPSIAPSGLMVYSGALVPEWKGDIFTGSLNSDYLSRLDPDTKAETGWAEERITAPETGRVRDVTEGPDGAIWFLSVTNGTLYRMAPGK